MAKKLVGPIRYYGGKCRLVSKLLPFVPDHQTYVEVFSGGAALFFAKDTSPVEVINDLDSGLVNLYRVLRDPEKFKRFQFLVSLTPYSREEHARCKSTWADCDDEVERAHRWFIINRMCYGGIFDSGFGRSVKSGRNGMATNVASYLSAIDRLPQIAARLMSVQIENLDFREIITAYDRPETFFYLDPPYVLSTRKVKAYRHEMSDQDHAELVDLLLHMKGKAVLSGYSNPFYESLESAGWARHDFKAMCTVANHIVKTDRSDTEFELNDRERVETVWVHT
ncbi:MAG: DNA adenine methylase [Desulfomonilaceae bacterium]